MPTGQSKFLSLVQGIRRQDPKLYDCLMALYGTLGEIQQRITIDSEGNILFKVKLSNDRELREILRFTGDGQILTPESPFLSPQNRFPYQFADAMRIGPTYLGQVFIGRGIGAGWPRGLEIRETDATHYSINARTAGSAGANDLVLQTAGGKVGIGTGATALTYDLELQNDAAGKPATAVWNVISDERTKRNKKVFTLGLAEVKQMNPSEAEYNGAFKTPEGTKVFGLTAQELLKIAPEMVIVPEDASKPMSINYHNLFPMFINAIKELSGQVDDLQKKLDDKEKK